MWGQNWVHLFTMMCPFPNKTIPDVTSEMKKRSWTNVDLLKQAEEFFVSIGTNTTQIYLIVENIFCNKLSRYKVKYNSSRDVVSLSNIYNKQ